MSKNSETILSILKDEAQGDVAAALNKMTKDYSMTWMYRGKSELFPSSKPDFTSEMKEVYAIKGRKYEIKNIAEGDEVVMVELIESYPNPETGEVHRTPLVLVLEMKEGKINRGRHYCDPAMSHNSPSSEEIERAYHGTDTKQVIE